MVTSSQLINAVSRYDDLHNKVDVNVEYVCELLKKLKVQIKNACSTLKPIKSEATLVDFLFRKKSFGKSEINHYRACAASISIDFIDTILKLAKNGHIPSNLLISFVIDLGETGLLGSSYQHPYTGRRYKGDGIQEFWNYYNVFFNGCCQQLTSEILSVFGLRQSLEQRFREILGLAWIDPISIHVKHAIIPKIIERNESSIIFKLKPTISIKQIMHIYEWTNFTIHYMFSRPTWMTWKAFEVCNGLFVGNDAITPNGRSIYSGVCMKEQTLLKMREEFKQQIAAQAKTIGVKTNTGTIYWNPPKAIIKDNNDKVIKVPKSTMSF